MTDDKCAVQVVRPGEMRSSVCGQDAKSVMYMQGVFIDAVIALGREFGYAEAASAILGAMVNFMLGMYTADSVKEILEGVIPNLQAMHDHIQNEYLMSVVDKGNPQ